MSIYTVVRKLGDGEMYVVALDDMAAAGILVQAYKQATSERYTLSVSEREVNDASPDRVMAVKFEYFFIKANVTAPPSAIRSGLTTRKHHFLKR